jgi:hypothetical protein
MSWARLVYVSDGVNLMHEQQRCLPNHQLLTFITSPYDNYADNWGLQHEVGMEILHNSEGRAG